MSSVDRTIVEDNDAGNVVIQIKLFGVALEKQSPTVERIAPGESAIWNKP